MKVKKSLVSVVITTRNEEKNIEVCLRSIRAQSYPKEKIEIIVVDNESSDKTKELALKYTKKVYDKGPERSAQRNYGMIDIAKGQFVMFVDADMILSHGLINACVNCIRTHDYAALHIPEIVLGKNYFSRVRRFERTFYNGTVIDGARFFSKELFIKAGGFDVTMSGPEDWDIDKKIKQIGKIGLLEESNSCADGWELDGFIRDRGVNPDSYGAVIYHNEAEFNLIKYLTKKGYYAKSFDGYIAKWGEDDPDIRKQFGLWYRYFGVFFENGKWKRLLASPLLGLGMFFLRGMVGVVFLLNKRK